MSEDGSLAKRRKVDAEDVEQQEEEENDDARLIEIRGSENSLWIPKEDVLLHPDTLLETILRNDSESKSINLQLNAVQMQLMASCFASKEQFAVDITRIYQKSFIETLNYLGISAKIINDSRVSLASHIISEIEPADLAPSQLCLLKSEITNLEKRISKHAESVRVKRRSQELQKYIPGFELKTVKWETLQKPCAAYRFAQRVCMPPHEVRRTTFTFSNKYGNNQEVIVVQNFGELTHTQDEDHHCEGASECFVNSIAVNAVVVVVFATQSPTDDEKRETEMRMEDTDELPEYFLKDWREKISFLDIEPFRTRCSIPPDVVSDVAICEWLWEL
eukprot:TRINITY_DN15431_c0_g3_i1.p1 TRINITY_DN15431_c0_g3~~TRINITY_DN15431_c0_g3_i1.p1  ORF type:complete len:344 (-),score=88.61 TRINITY_DN15431_c0_g3_i1:129-1127(-)